MASQREMLCSVSKRLVLHVLDATTLSLVLIVQGSILNYYIISYYSTNVNGYFLFIADFISLFIFAGTMTISYQYLTHLENTARDSTFYLSPKRFMCTKYPSSKLGILPLSYMSWLFYAAILIAKVLLIFKTEIPDMLANSDFFGPQALQITIALSGIIFLLLAEGHNSEKRHTMRYEYVTSTCAKTGIEILDSVSLLSLLLVNSSTMVLTTELENTVLIICVLTYLLPALALYRLSLAREAEDKVALPLKVIYNLLHLFLIDVPFLTLRVYIWYYYHYDASIFLMKNVFGIFNVLRHLFPDIREILRKRKKDGEATSRRNSGYLQPNPEDEIELRDVVHTAQMIPKQE